MTGIYSLTKKEIKKFMGRISHTIFPPVVSTLLFLAIFHFILGSRGEEISGIKYIEFLIPGLVMMAVINNSFLNSSFSFFYSKFVRYMKHILSAPLSYMEITLSYIIASMARALITALVIIVAVLPFVKVSFSNIFIIIIYFLIASFTFSSAGIIVGMWAEQFDHVGIFDTFFIMPLTMLGGVFYSISVLPQKFQFLTKLNPIFYLVDGFRYGMIGLKDSSVLQGVSISLVLGLVFFLAVFYLLKIGWRIRE